MASTAFAVLMMSQVVHTPAGPAAEPGHAPLAVVIENVSEPEITSVPARDEVSAGSQSGHHNHGSSIGSVHVTVAILVLGLAMLLRRTVWAVRLRPLQGLHATRWSLFAMALIPPALVSVVDEGCLLRV